MIHNPRNQQLTLMRPSFSGSLLEVIRQNLHMGVKSIAVFEVGSRYYDLGKPMPEEEKMLAFGLCGSKPSSWLERERPFAWHELKGMVTTILGCLRGVSLPEFLEYRSDIWPGFAPSQGFEIYHKGTWLGVFGAIRQDVCTRFDIEKPVLYGALSLAALAKMTKPELRYQNISKYPSVERDIALVVDESVRADDLRACISVLGKDWIQQIQLFDVFRGGKLPQGKKSVAFRLTYQSKERTLETAEVNELHFSIANALNERFKAELPSKA